MVDVLAVLAAVALGATSTPPMAVSLTAQDGGMVDVDVYGSGVHGVVLAHGGRFDKTSWSVQAQALADAGYRVVALNFRGYGASKAPPTARAVEEGRRFDVLAAVRYLRKAGATTVSVIGASMGGDYAAEAAATEPDAIDRFVLLAAGAYTPLTTMKGRKLFIMSRDDVIGDGKPRLPAIRAQFEKASPPKDFVVLDGAAHAQAIFETAQGPRALREILQFLAAP